MIKLELKIFLLFVGFFIVIAACENNAAKNDDDNELVLKDNHFVAVPMPAKLITGDPFPTDSNTINGWVAKSTVNPKTNLEENKDIINHGWAIWQALVEVTDQVNNDQPLRRFETWFTPADIQNAYEGRKQNKDFDLIHQKRNTGALGKMNQFHGEQGLGDPSDGDVTGFVKFDPIMAKHIFDKELLLQSTLDKLLKKGEIAEIPPIPLGGVSIKPAFVTSLGAPINKGGVTLYKIPYWPGDGGNPNRAFGPSQWKDSIYVAIDGETVEEDNIYSINDFIHFKIDSAQATNIANFLLEANPKPAQAGDYAILIAMHVTTKENKRWTWQTFWWSKNPDNPYSPSSEKTASLRPRDKLDRAANHYAMSVAYNMVSPAQPYYGGSAKDAISLYAYNPYLEAEFDPTNFKQGADSVKAYYPESYLKVGNRLNEFGMQTNCMSCHSQARYIESLYEDSSSYQLYIPNEYVDLQAPYFKSTVQLDFSWAIKNNIIKDK